jgi:hypothetical protein
VDGLLERYYTALESEDCMNRLDHTVTKETTLLVQQTTEIV